MSSRRHARWASPAVPNSLPSRQECSRSLHNLNDAERTSFFQDEYAEWPGPLLALLAICTVI